MSSGRSGWIDPIWVCAACRMAGRRCVASSVSTVPGSTTLTRTRVADHLLAERLGERVGAELGQVVDAAARPGHAPFRSAVWSWWMMLEVTDGQGVRSWISGLAAGEGAGNERLRLRRDRAGRRLA